MTLRRSELVLAAYFAYTTLLSFVRPIEGHLRARILVANVLLAVLYSAMIRRRWTFGRDWLPYPIILLAYKEMGWLALPHTSTALEESWIVWDRLLLHDWGLRGLIEGTGPFLPNLLELSYLLVYAVPAYGVFVFYFTGNKERLDRFYTVLLSGTLMTYALYPYFPSEPPRAVFPGADLPVMSLLRQANLDFVNGYGIHTSVFPSGHVAAAFSAAFGLLAFLPEQRKRGYGLLVLASLIAVSTVYGRYHYAVDAVAGFAVAVAALGFSLWWWRKPQPSA